MVGFDRFFAGAQDDRIDADWDGRLLLTELNCTSCHKTQGAAADTIGPRKAPLLDGVGGRIRPSFLRAFLADPQAAKPGTTMPNVLAMVPPAERQESIEALAQFLASTGTFIDVPPIAKNVELGKKYFHQVGCAACHGPRSAAVKADTHVLPLGELTKKYSIVSLTGFLHDPLKARPSGRMPNLNLNSNESTALAHYLLSDLIVKEDAPAPPQPQETLVKKGRGLFASLGCAACHDLKDGNQNIASTLTAPVLSALHGSAGCLAPPAAAAGKPAPRYALSAPQRTALARALATPAKAAPDPRQAVARTLATFNCYACHQRDGVGGVQTGVNEFFTSTQKEMGDEGRLPPHLSGVGGKLTSAYLKKVLADGGTDRPYMLTRMPRFGEANLAHLQTALEQADPVPTAPTPQFKVEDKQVKAAGRNMVGNRTFGCIKCHNFHEYKSEGVQGINMTLMTERVRREWFTQYLLDPNKFRPGTRMPAAWPFGQSQLKNVLEGDTGQQIEAVWRFLADGKNAALPYGLVKELMPLVARDSPIIYRNFITGAGNRAIGVGYPEKINLAFDANDLRYALLWHKEFIDASKHWTGRGEGPQRPLGEGILQMEPGPSIAVLSTPDEAWPTKAAKDKGYKFGGYHLGEGQRPVFLYSVGDVHVGDFMLPMQDKDGVHFQRTLSIESTTEPANLWYRAASGTQIKSAEGGWYAVDADLKVRVDAGGAPIVRAVNGKMELLVPIRGKQGKIVAELVW